MSEGKNEKQKKALGTYLMREPSPSDKLAEDLAEAMGRPTPQDPVQQAMAQFVSSMGQREAMQLQENLMRLNKIMEDTIGGQDDRTNK